MKHIIQKKYRNPESINKIVDEIHNIDVDINIMEVCGSHTMAIGKWGIRKLVPRNVHLISGPGCPVCVTPTTFIDALYNLKNKTVAIFGDLLRVPGSKGNLEQARAEGLDIKIIYSPLEALELAKKNETVLAGIGFETTIPGIAQTIMLAKKQNITNFSVLPAFKTVPMALRVLMNDKDVKLDGFLLPGHVSIITGLDMYNFITEEYKKSGVVAGFEPYDVLHAIKSLMLMKKNKNPQITNEYTRVVKNSGNIIAQKIIDEVLEPIDVIWRGLGTIPNSGLSIRKKFEDFDASKKYNIDLTKEGEEITGCQCGDVLKGKIIPPSCKLFGEVCNPSNPIGPCMVSSEGSCAAYYKYEDYEK